LIEGQLLIGLEMTEQQLPPHLKIAETVTEEEFSKAKWQSRVIFISALVSGIVVAGVLVLFVTGGVKGLIGGGLVAIGIERLLDRMLPEGRKMKTQRMKIYPDLRDFRRRQDG